MATDIWPTVLLLLLFNPSFSAHRIKKSVAAARDVTFDQFGIPKYKNSPPTNINLGVSNKVVPNPAHERGAKAKFTSKFGSPGYGAGGGHPQPSAQSYGGSKNPGPSYASQSGACYCPCAAGFAGSTHPIPGGYPHKPVVTLHQQPAPAYPPPGNSPSPSSSYGPPPGYIAPVQPHGPAPALRTYPQPAAQPSYGSPKQAAPQPSYGPAPSSNSYGAAPQPSPQPSSGQPKTASQYGGGSPSVSQPHPQPEPLESQAHYLRPPTFLIQQPLPAQQGYGGQTTRSQPANQGYGNPQPSNSGYRSPSPTYPQQQSQGQRYPSQRTQYSNNLQLFSKPGPLFHSWIDFKN